MIKKCLSTLLFLFAVNLSFGQIFAKEMKAALLHHDTASIVTTEVVALQAFEKLMKKYPEEWLPAYWASYLCTQIARLEGRSPEFPKDMNAKELLQRSQQYFDYADKALAEKTKQEQSDFHVLQGFIYSFFAGTIAKNGEEKGKYFSMMDQEYRKAIKANPTNPLFLVLKAIRLGTSPESQYGDVAAAIALLEYCKQIYDAAPNRALTTYWNKDFIGFWKSRAEKNLTKVLEEEYKPN